MYGYIYLITNSQNEKTYVGKHKSDRDFLADNYYGSGTYIKNAIKKYGRENFKKELLQYCESLEELNEREVFWISYYRSLGKAEYNHTRGGDGGVCEGQSEETRSKISAAMKGNKWNLGKRASEGTKEKMKKAHLGKKYKTMSEIGRLHISEAMSGKPSSKKGIKLSEEIKLKISETKKGRLASEETKKKMTAAHLGKKLVLCEDGRRHWV